MDLSLDNLLQQKQPVLPIWRAGSSKHPECIGTGTLVFLNGHCYLLSAAHVFEALRGNDFYVYAVDRFEPIEKVPIALSALTEKFSLRREDPFDIGAALLPNNVIDRINGRAVFITPEMVSHHQLSPNDTLYRVLGFPSGKNERMWEKHRHGGKSFQSHVYQIKTTDVGTTFFPQEPFVREYHLPLDFNQNIVLDEEGKEFKPPDMHGISGGLVIAEGVNTTRPEAIVIQKNIKKNSLISVRMTKVFEWLECHTASMLRF